MATRNYTGSHVEQLNQWHLDLAMCVDLCDLLMTKERTESEELYSSAGFVCVQRFRDLLDSCPFPDNPTND